MSDRIKIGISGGPGSFSEEAAVYCCAKNKIRDYEIKHLITVENTLSFLDEGKIDLGVFPIENSNGGVVYESLYAMAKHNFSINNIFEIDVRQNLLALPNALRKDIKKIVSHQQALKQCRMYLKRNWPESELIEWEDTAKAASDLSLGKLSENSAVIAPLRCKDLYGLNVIEENIQDLKFNFTSFLAVSKYEY